MKKRIAILALASASLFSGAVLAATQTDIPTFEALDMDRNGFISSEEAASCEALISDFATIDTNQDGKLDQVEFAAFTDKAEAKS